MPVKQRSHAVISLIVLLGVCFAVAGFGAQFEPGAWYQSLSKPPWNPPDWIFAPVWSVLFISMALAAWLVLRSQRAGRRMALLVFAIQLILNGAWSWLFFGLHEPGLALLELVLLWIAILVTILLFARIRRLAALLLIPYLAWVSFAGALNYSLWQLNMA